MNGLYLHRGDAFWCSEAGGVVRVTLCRLGPRPAAARQRRLLRDFGRRHGLAALSWDWPPGFSPEVVRANMRPVPPPLAGADLPLMAAAVS